MYLHKVVGVIGHGGVVPRTAVFTEEKYPTLDYRYISKRKYYRGLYKVSTFSSKIYFKISVFKVFF
jgi:hypothetical protein